MCLPYHDAIDVTEVGWFASNFVHLVPAFELMILLHRLEVRTDILLSVPGGAVACVR
jgi:hypothetical protein